MEDAAREGAIHQARLAREIAEQLRGGDAVIVARNGDFYFNQFIRQGLEKEARVIRDAWESGGPDAAVASIPNGMMGQFDFVGELPACQDHLRSQRDAGIDIHTVSIVGAEGSVVSKALRKLAEV